MRALAVKSPLMLAPPSSRLSCGGVFQVADAVNFTIKQRVAEHLGDGAGEVQVCRRPGDIQLVDGQNAGVEVVAIDV